MKLKKKICKGNYRSDHFKGCGKNLYIFKYGLCQKCFNKWLIQTDKGKEHLQKQIIPQAKKDVKKEWKKKKREIKRGLKTHKDWLKDLQIVFNSYIRQRDKYKPCISCNNRLGKKYDAGHYFSVGAYPNLRFNEDNVHAQCVACNQHRHGNINEYTIQLPKRIGIERFEALKQLRNDILKLSIPEIKEKITYYKSKLK